MFFQYIGAMLREWVFWVFFGLDLIGLLIVYAPLTDDRFRDFSIPPVVFWLIPSIGVLWAGYRVYASVPRPSSQQDHARARDLQVLAELNDVFPANGSVRWLRDYDFGSAFKLDWLKDLHSLLAKSEDPAFEFIDEDLEPLRLALIEKVAQFTQLIGHESFPVKGDPNGGIVSRIQPEMRNDDPEQFRLIQSRANGIAQEVVKAYDVLIRAARRSL